MTPVYDDSAPRYAQTFFEMAVEGGVGIDRQEGDNVVTYVPVTDLEVLMFPELLGVPYVKTWQDASGIVHAEEAQLIPPAGLEDDL